MDCIRVEPCHAARLVVKNAVRPDAHGDAREPREQCRAELAVERDAEVEMTPTDLLHHLEHLAERIFLGLVVEKNDIVDNGIVLDGLPHDGSHEHRDARTRICLSE